jgi:hypothetical protein
LRVHEKRLVTAILLLFGSLARAQPEPQPDMTIDAATRNLVIDRAVALLNEHYVFPGVAKEMAAAVRQHQKQGEYDSITSALATQPISRLQSLSMLFSQMPIFTGWTKAEQAVVCMAQSLKQGGRLSLSWEVKATLPRSRGPFGKPSGRCYKSRSSRAVTTLASRNTRACFMASW